MSGRVVHLNSFLGRARDCGRNDLDGDQCDVCFQHDGMNSLS